jgi:hypothetical protein
MMRLRNTDKKYLVKESIVIEYRVSNRKIQKSIGVLLANTDIEVLKYRMQKKTIGCPALATDTLQSICNQCSIVNGDVFEFIGRVKTL